MESIAIHQFIIFQQGFQPCFIETANFWQLHEVWPHSNVFFFASNIFKRGDLDGFGILLFFAFSFPFPKSPRRSHFFPASNIFNRGLSLGGPFHLYLNLESGYTTNHYFSFFFNGYKNLINCSPTTCRRLEPYNHSDSHDKYQPPAKYWVPRNATRPPCGSFCPGHRPISGHCGDACGGRHDRDPTTTVGNV